jgi:NTE family protein
VWKAIEKSQPPDLTAINPFMSKALASMAGMVSPYDFNPLGFDPLRKLLTEEIDFKVLQEKSPVELLIAATDVATGRPRLFRRHDMRVEAVLASACLPTVHHAVEIDGRAYWDGGFSANPDLVTLATEAPVEDTLIVVLNHAVRPKPPKTATEIAAHISEITFNQPFLRDVELIAAARGTKPGWFSDGGGSIARLRRHRFHVIETGRHTANLATVTKMKPDAELLSYLYSAGRTEAAKWLGRHQGDVGKRDTAELETRYLGDSRKVSDAAVE